MRNRNAKNGLSSQIFLPDTTALGTSIEFAPDLNEIEAIHGATTQTGDVFVFRYQLNNKDDLNTTNPRNSNSPCSRNIALEDGEDPALEVHVVTTYFFVDQQGELSCRAKREVIVDMDPDPVLVNNIIICMKPTGGCVTTPSAEPIISNVEKLIVKYGVDNNGDGSANYYVEAANVTNWTWVVAVKLFIVMRSEDDNLTQGNSTYTVEDQIYGTIDKRYYRVFSTTIAFRN